MFSTIPIPSPCNRLSASAHRKVPARTPSESSQATHSHPIDTVRFDPCFHVESQSLSLSFWDDEQRCPYRLAGKQLRHPLPISNLAAQKPRARPEPLKLLSPAPPDEPTTHFRTCWCWAWRCVRREPLRPFAARQWLAAAAVLPPAMPLAVSIFLSHRQVLNTHRETSAA